ncbi:MAG: hypothetical protein SP1CHLAM54_15430 [Chlamydiia bacterium]|nr:hypothetical protein [Chlamydiia bacterium]MCH9616433.1 hypothetical protein [Chlamydiia bacterium]MCH9629581.1 hypothetical protein [Chlamydiia bacterium]
MLTVCLSNYNHAKYLEERIPSVLESMPEDAEFIITDDGSTDASVQILKRLQKRDQRIKLRLNAKNQGVISSVNAMLEIAKGEYISFISSDDLLTSEFYPKLLKLTEKYPGFGVYVSDFSVFKEGKKHYQSLMPKAKDVQVLDSKKVQQLFATTGFWIPGHSSIFRTSLVCEFKRFEPSLKHYCDWVINHGCALKGGVVFLPEYLSAWRLDGGNYSETDESQKKEVELCVMRYLNRKENKIWRRLFRKSHLLRDFMKPRLVYFFLRPKYWDYLFCMLTRSFYNRSKLKAKVLLNRIS